jgi:uncharacterized membrane protein (UPF0127 family)
LRFFAALFLIAAALTGTASALESFRTAALAIETADGKRHDFTVELAETPKQQEQGLMFRRDMKPDAGMLFVGDGDAVLTMWMKNTFIPLDMVFIAKDGRITHIRKRAVPQSLETISSGGPVRAVLELNSGVTDRLGIKPGDRVIYDAFKD